MSGGRHKVLTSAQVQGRGQNGKVLEEHVGWEIPLWPFWKISSILANIKGQGRMGSYRSPAPHPLTHTHTPYFADGGN